jgi:hypothetical protein
LLSLGILHINENGVRKMTARPSARHCAMPHTNAVDRLTLINKYERVDGRSPPPPPQLPEALVRRAEHYMGLTLAERQMLGC